LNHRIQLTIDSLEGKKDISFEVKKIINGGHSARDKSSVQAHIKEMEKIKIPGPKNIPTFIPLSNNMITTESTIQVQHEKTNGEIEFMLLQKEGEWYVTIGSDHSDRDLATYSIPASKQVYPNIIAPIVWPVNEVVNHWDEIEMKLWVVVNGEKELYQNGKFEEILPLNFWIRKMEELNLNKHGSAVMAGTIQTKGELKYGERIEFEMNDPVLKRKIHSFYDLFILMPAIE